MDALVVEQLPEVDDGRLVALEEGGQALGVALVGEPLVRVAGVGRVAAGLVEQVGQSLVPGLGPERVDVHPGRHLVHALDVADDLLQHPADVLGADEDRAGARERLAGPRGQLGVTADRVLELRAVGFHRIRRARGGGDRAAEQDVVREDEVSGKLGTDRGGVRLDEAIALLARQLR